MAPPMRLPILDPRLALRGVDPRFAATEDLAADPAGSVVASGRNSILFPPQPSAGILTPDDRAILKRNAILQVAASLLQAGGRSPNQRGTLANVGAALAGLDLPGAMQSALRMRAVTDELQQRASARAALQDIVARHPAMPGEDRDQKFNRLTDIVIEAAGVPGLEDWIGKTSNVLAQLRPPRERSVLRTAMVDEQGNVVLQGGTPAIVPFDPDTGEQLGPARAGAPPAPPALTYDETGNPVLVSRPVGGQAPTTQAVPGMRVFRPELFTPTQGELDAANWAPGVFQGFTEFSRALRNNKAAVQEAVPFLQTIDITASIPGVGNAISGVVRGAAQAGLSPDAQKVVQSFLRWTASRVFAAGGKQLTQNEIRAAMGQYLPAVGEDAGTTEQRLTSMAQDALGVLQSTGRAYPRIRQNLSAAGAPDLGDFDPYTQRFTGSVTFEDLLHPQQARQRKSRSTPSWRDLNPENQP